MAKSAAEPAVTPWDPIDVGFCGEEWEPCNITLQRTTLRGATTAAKGATTAAAKGAVATKTETRFALYPFSRCSIDPDPSSRSRLIVCSRHHDNVL